MASIRLENLDMVYPGIHVALRGLNLDVADGELLVLVGPSGCGKTTTLRLVAGLETPTRGRIFLDGRDETATAPRLRDMAMVFQGHALYPHLTVRGNLEFPLRLQRLPRTERMERVGTTATLLGLGGLLDRRPTELSGGEQQRVALGRAIVRRPRAFLLDEPLSNLDAQTRSQLRLELAHLHRRLGTTMLYVTHDQEEAMSLGQRIVVLRAGEVQQIATPAKVYDSPVNAFVAGFIGSPPMNLLRCVRASGELGSRLSAPFFPQGLTVPGIDVATREILLGIRPQDLRLVDERNADIVAGVDMVQICGSERIVFLKPLTDPMVPPLAAVLSAHRSVHPGERLGLAFPRDRLHFFDVRTGLRCESSESTEG
jgi:ABC-type sugar transport system ATPase subunit